MKNCYKESFLIGIARVIGLVILATITFWCFDDYRITDSIIISFPLLISPYPGRELEKTLAELIYPLVINFLLWMPKKKICDIMNFIFTVEKWKYRFILVYSLYIFLSCMFFYPIAYREYFYGLLIAVMYYLSLKYIFLEYYKKYNDISFGDCKKIGIVIFLYVSISVYCTISPAVYNEKLLEEMTGEIYGNLNEEMELIGKNIKLSSDRTKLLGFYSKESKSNIIIMDVKSEEKIKKLSMENVIGANFTNDNDIMIEKESADNRVIDIEVFDFRKNLKTKSFKRVNITSEEEKICFSPEGRYFLLVGKEIYLFDYQKGNMICSIKEEFYGNSVGWLGNDRFFVISQMKNKITTINCFVIDSNGKIKKEKKNIITDFIRRKLEQVRSGELIVEGLGQGDRIVMIIQGIPLNGVEPYRSSISLLEVGCENILYEKIFKDRIVDLDISDGKVIVFQSAKANSIKVMFLDQSLRKCSESIIIKKNNNNSPFALKWNELKLIDGGRKIIELGDGINVWNASK